MEHRTHTESPVKRPLADAPLTASAVSIGKLLYWSDNYVFARSIHRTYMSGFVNIYLLVYYRRSPYDFFKGDLFGTKSRASQRISPVEEVSPQVRRI